MLNSSISLLIVCVLELPIIAKGILKPPTVRGILSVSPYNSISVFMFLGYFFGHIEFSIVLTS